MRFCQPALFLAASLSICACAPRAPVTEPAVSIAFASPAREAAATSFDTVTIRARLVEGDMRGELRGAPCRIQGPGYDARFVTPAILNLPVFGNDAPALALSCRYENETRSLTLRAVNLSEKARRDARREALDDIREDGGGLAVIVTLGLPRRDAPGFDAFDYPDQSITFRRAPQ
ncbi:MAG: hypothetical protein AAF841_13965 [Pseudomonadota bacterium]